MSTHPGEVEGWEPPAPPEDLTGLYGQLGFGQTVASLTSGSHIEGASHLADRNSASLYRVEHHLATMMLRIATPTPLRRDGQTSLEWTQERVQALEAGRKRPVFEQLVTYSIENEAVITLFAPGEDLRSLPTEIVEAITSDKLAEAVEGIATGAEEAQIGLDANARNFLYEPSKGFTILDYDLGERRKRPPSPETELSHFLTCLASDTTYLNSLPQHRAAWLRVFEQSVALVRERGIDPYKVRPLLAEDHRHLQQ